MAPSEPSRPTLLRGEAKIGRQDAEEDSMRLPQEAIEQIHVLARGGFETPERVVEIICEAAYEPGELDANEVAGSVRQAFRALQAEMRAWPEITDCDRLDQVFAVLNSKGIVSVQNAGYTQSDGFDAVKEAARGRPDRNGLTGYCFYHGQDLERAISGAGLYLAFGPKSAAREEQDGPLIGAIIVEQLQGAGIGTEWNGSFGQRIHCPRLDWKRRPVAG